MNKKVPRHQESVQFKIPENLPFVPGKISPPSHIKELRIFRMFVHFEMHKYIPGLLVTKF